MAGSSISRRAILKSLSIGAAAGSVMHAIPLEAAEYVHGLIATEKADSKSGVYVPKFFDPHQFQALQALCDSIFPVDEDSGGAIEGGAPEFIDLITSENPEYQAVLGGGLKWLDSACTSRYSSAYLGCTPQQRREILDRIAYRKNRVEDESLTQGIEFFSLLRNLTADGFFTSKIGIKYLGYKGNTFLTEFPGCPPVPGI